MFRQVNENIVLFALKESQMNGNQNLNLISLPLRHAPHTLKLINHLVDH
jgi:hypothetical protein